MHSSEKKEEKQVPSWLLIEAMITIEHMFKLIDDDVRIENVCSPILIEWWNKHCEKENEALRRKAAMKLTESERKALGIDDRGQNILKVKKKVFK